MAIAETCGHDRRGNEILSDDIKEVAKEYHQWAQAQGIVERED